VSEQAPDVDWTEVERRGRRWNWLTLPLVPAFFGAVVLLTGGYGIWEGRAAWLVVGCASAFFLVVHTISVSTARLRARTGQGFRIQHAVRHRVDPGPDLRTRTDLYARRMAGSGWFVWLFPFLPVSFLLQGRWDRPLLSVPAAVVLVSAVVAFTLWWRRQVAAAGRWMADPPGPEREFPPPKAWERWLTGRRFLWLLLGFLLVNALVVVVLVLVLD
jgi:hypothetical protein